MGLSPSAEFSFVLKDSEQRAVAMLSISHGFVSSMFNQQGLLNPFLQTEWEKKLCISIRAGIEFRR